MKSNGNFIYIFFLENHLQVRPLDGFSRAMAQTTVSHARMCLLGVKKINIDIFIINVVNVFSVLTLLVGIRKGNELVKNSLQTVTGASS